MSGSGLSAANVAGDAAGDAEGAPDRGVYLVDCSSRGANKKQ
jgi:hypothetical protein